MQQRVLSPSPVRGAVGQQHAALSGAVRGGVQPSQMNIGGGQVSSLIRAVLLCIVSIPVLVVVARQFGLLALVLMTFVLYRMGFLHLITMLFRWVMSTDSNFAYREALRRADTMAQPIVTKDSHSSENHVLKFGFSAMQGWRRAMEDAHTAILEPFGGFFAIFDGHSGPGTAQYCGDNLYRFISRHSSFESKQYQKAMYEGFLAIDRHLHVGQHVRDRSGCTAVSLLVVGDELICANAGDSRCVLCRDGQPFPLSNDHKPYSPAEQLRIERAGGYVWNRRVNGVLALSRAIGDFMFKNNTQVSWEDQAVTAAPEIRTTRLDRERDEFAVVACDGIWDCMSNEQVTSFVRTHLSRGVPIVEVCDRLMHACLSPHPFGLGCDNMSVIIVVFKPLPNPLHQQGSAATAVSSSSVSAAPEVRALATDSDVKCDEAEE